MAPQFPLLDREYESEVLAEAVRQVAGGRGRFLVIEGAAGIGKSRLLGQARQVAQAAGVAVLVARGSEWERQLPFGIVRQLFEPALRASGGVDGNVLLDGAAAGAAHVFAPVPAIQAQGSPEPAELATLHGLYWLTAGLSSRPTALLVDDLHWSDVASLRYLAYLQPRLEDLPLLVMVVVRTGEGAAGSVALEGVTAQPEVTVLHPRPLSEPAVGLLLSSVWDREVDSAFAASCAKATAGNPFLVVALAQTMVREHVSPTVANRGRVSTLGPEAISRQVSHRLTRLPQPNRSIAEAVSVLGPGTTLSIVAELADCPVLTAADLVEELVRLGLLEFVGGRETADPMVSFAHPLVGAAVYDTMTIRGRAEAHARAAQVLARRGADPERVAAHLVNTPPGLGHAAVSQLRRAGEAAAGRGSPEAAFVFFQRCLAEDIEPGQRRELLLAASAVAVHVDLQAAVRLLEEARTHAMDPADAADIAARLGVAYGYLHDPGQARDAFAEALRLLPPDQEDQRRRVQAALLVGAVVAPGQQRVAERLDDLRALPTGEGLGARMLEAAIAIHEMAAGDPQAKPRARAALAGGRLVREANGEGALVCGWLTLLAADDDTVLQSLEDAVRQAHLHGSLRALAPAYTFRALGRVWTGQLADAEADARQGLELAETGRVDMDPTFAAAYLADTLMEQGRLEDAASILRGVHVPADMSSDRPRYYAVDAYVRLLRRQGNHAAAVTAAVDAGRIWSDYGFGNPAVGSWRSEAALALFVLGQVDDARRWAEEELDLAARWAAPRAHGRALRVLGQVVGGASGLALLSDSVSVLEDGPARLERARSLVEYGAALRRAGRRSEAREALTRGLDEAEICAAAPLVEQARQELRTAGFRPRRRRLVGPDALTASERRVAELAAGGASNREIAQTLFVTTKTVEVHLTSAYRKLGVSRRSELIHHLGQAGSQ